VHGLFTPQAQELAFPHVELHEIPVGLLLQPVEVPLHGSTTVSYSSQLSNICKLAESVILSRQLLYMLKSISPSIDPWDTPLVTVLQLHFVLLLTL